jgi:hypothetical protein
VKGGDFFVDEVIGWRYNLQLMGGIEISLLSEHQKLSYLRNIQQLEYWFSTKLSIINF